MDFQDSISAIIFSGLINNLTNVFELTNFGRIKR